MNGIACEVCTAPAAGRWSTMALCSECMHVAIATSPDALAARANALWVDTDDESVAASLRRYESDVLVNVANWLRCVRGMPLQREPGA